MLKPEGHPHLTYFQLFAHKSMHVYINCPTNLSIFTYRQLLSSASGYLVKWNSKGKWLIMWQCNKMRVPKQTDDCYNNFFKELSSTTHYSQIKWRYRAENVKLITWTCSPNERIILTVRKKSNFSWRSGQGSGTCEVGTPAITSAYASRISHHTLWSSSVKLDVYQLPCHLLPEGR